LDDRKGIWLVKYPRSNSNGFFLGETGLTRRTPALFEKTYDTKQKQKVASFWILEKKCKNVTVTCMHIDLKF